MNKVIFTGRTTADVELRYTQDNLAIGTFSLAVDDQSRSKAHAIANSNLARVIRRQIANMQDVIVVQSAEGSAGVSFVEDLSIGNGQSIRIAASSTAFA